MNYPTICVDGFYKYPDIIREYALRQDYCLSSNGRWPGKRTGKLKNVNPAFYDFFCKKFCQYMPQFSNPDRYDIITFFQLFDNFSEEKDSLKNTGFIHSDICDYSFVIYLNTEIQKESGTSIFELKDEEKRNRNIQSHNEIRNDLYTKNIDLGYEQMIEENESAYEETVRFYNQYNRMIGYFGEKWHRANSFYSASQPRLIQVGFIYKKYDPITDGTLFQQLLVK